MTEMTDKREMILDSLLLQRQLVEKFEKKYHLDENKPSENVLTVLAGDYRNIRSRDELVTDIAREYLGVYPVIDEEKLIQAGNIALKKAAAACRDDEEKLFPCSAWYIHKIINDMFHRLSDRTQQSIILDFETKLRLDEVPPREDILRSIDESYSRDMTDKLPPIAGELAPDDPVRLYFDEIEKAATPCPERESALFERIRSGDEEAKKELLETYLRLAANIAAQYLGSCNYVPFLDLIQEANFGLIKATERYDESAGYSFYAFASWYIHLAICRSYDNVKREVPLLFNTRMSLVRIWSAYDELSLQLGRAPTLDELCNKAYFSVQQAEEYFDRAEHVRKLKHLLATEYKESFDE